MDILESLVNALVVEYPSLGRFAKAKPLLKVAQDRRNRVAHGMWAYEDGQVSKLRATARGKLKTSIDPISLTDLDETFAAIGSAGRAILDVVFNTDKYSGAVVPDEP